MRLSAAERRVIGEVAQTLREQFGAIEVRLFGSGARGDMADESDIDLFVVVPRIEDDTLERITDACTVAGRKCNRLISFVLFEEAELRAGPVSQSPLVLKVAREGVPV